MEERLEIFNGFCDMNDKLHYSVIIVTSQGSRGRPGIPGLVGRKGPRVSNA